MAVALFAVAGCSGGAPATAPGSVPGATGSSAAPPTIASTPSTAATASATAADTPASSATETAGPTGVPTSIDPCQLFTAAEASQLTGATYGAGEESTTSGNGKMCTYGAQTLNVFEVVVAVAPDVATAQAERQAAEADVMQQAPGAHFTEVTGLGDNAAVAQGSYTVSGHTLSASGVYVLKGAVFFSLNDLALGHAPTAAALETAAQVVLGRLP